MIIHKTRCFPTSRNALFTLCAAVVLASGCSSGKPDPGAKAVAVSGTVTMGGQPLADAEVVFMAQDFSDRGTTDANGKYKLTKGALPGSNKIYISKWNVPGGTKLNPAEGLDAGQLQAAAASVAAEAEQGVQGADPSKGPKQLVPEQFSSPEKTTLTFDVPASGSQQADFKLGN
jgi:hypothetical protein